MLAARWLIRRRGGKLVERDVAELHLIDKARMAAEMSTYVFSNVQRWVASQPFYYRETFADYPVIDSIDGMVKMAENYVQTLDGALNWYRRTSGRALLGYGEAALRTVTATRDIIRAVRDAVEPSRGGQDALLRAAAAAETAATAAAAGAALGAELAPETFRRVGGKPLPSIIYPNEGQRHIDSIRTYNDRQAEAGRAGEARGLWESVAKMAHEIAIGHAPAAQKLK